MCRDVSSCVGWGYSARRNAFVYSEIYFIMAGETALAEADFNKAAQLSPDGERTPMVKTARFRPRVTCPVV